MCKIITNDLLYIKPFQVHNYTATQEKQIQKAYSYVMHV